jgi:uridine kinase
MLSDILLIGEQHKAAAKEIAERVLAERYSVRDDQSGHKFVVAISGESGSGKSELSHVLAMLLKKEGVRVKILHTDNYYHIPPLQRRSWRINRDFDSIGLDEYDWNLLHKHIQEFREGRQTVIPCVDIVTEEVDDLITDFSRIELLVVEGLYAVGIDGADLRVFIDLTYHETKKNQDLRGKEPADDYRRQVLEREHQSVRSLRHLSDLFVNKAYKVVEAGEFYSSSNDFEYEYVTV